MMAQAEVRYHCEWCGARTRIGFRCDACELALLASLLDSTRWCAIAATRSGTREGESLLVEIERQYQSLAEQLPREVPR